MNAPAKCPGAHLPHLTAPLVGAFRSELNRIAAKRSYFTSTLTWFEIALRWFTASQERMAKK